MSLQGAQHRHLVVLDGKTLQSGGSLQISNGVLAVVDNDPRAVTQNGRKILSSFSGLPKSKEFQIVLGTPDNAVSRSTTNKPFESLPFKLDEIVDFKVVAPKEKGIKVDDFIIGYNGTAGTEIVLGERTASSIDITLMGDAIAQLGYDNKQVTVKLMFEAPYVDENGAAVDAASVTNQEVVENAVKRFNNMKLMGNVPITDYVEAIPVNSNNGTLDNLISYTYQNLSINDYGDANALGRVQAQYPTFKVVRTDRLNDTTSVYTILAPTGTSLPDYSVGLSSVFASCGTCPSGYSALTGGFVYSVTIVDGGADLSTTIDDIAGFVSGTVHKLADQNGVGTYSVVVSAILTDAQIATFKGGSNTKSTAVFALEGAVQALCSDSATTTTSWVAGTTCSAEALNFRITLKDTDCGTSRLTELQAHYPNLTIVEDTPNLSRTITLTGSGGTAHIVIGGVTYTATFDTDLSTTRANFVTANAAAIHTQTGGTLTGTGATITLVDAVDGYPSITVANVTGNLAGTVATAVASGNVIAGMCQRTYRTSVITNIVCDECSVEFRDLFTATAPNNYMEATWATAPTVFDPTAKMGIRFRGKIFTMSGTEQFRDEMPFHATSTRLLVAGGQPQFIAESWNSTNHPYKLTVFGIASEPEGLGGYLWEMEDQSRHYFTGIDRLEGNNYGKWLWGQETKLKGLSQYVDYQITIQPKKYFQLTPHASAKITYHCLVEYGSTANVEALLNSLATAAGLEAQVAFV